MAKSKTSLYGQWKTVLQQIEASYFEAIKSGASAGVLSEIEGKYDLAYKETLKLASAPEKALLETGHAEFVRKTQQAAGAERAAYRSGKAETLKKQRGYDRAAREAEATAAKEATTKASEGAAIQNAAKQATRRAQKLYTKNQTPTWISKVGGKYGKKIDAALGKKATEVELGLGKFGKFGEAAGGLAGGFIKELPLLALLYALNEGAGFASQHGAVNAQGTLMQGGAKTSEEYLEDMRNEKAAMMRTMEMTNGNQQAMQQLLEQMTPPGEVMFGSMPQGPAAPQAIGPGNVSIEQILGQLGI